LSRERIEKFELEFAELHRARCDLASAAGNERIYSTSDTGRLWPVSVGLYLIRSAAVVEQTINGLTVRLWDDPFEWTLPERLPTVTDLIAYFVEVEAARLKGFKFLQDDLDLDRTLPAPANLKTLDQLLTETYESSSTYLSRAGSMLSNDKDTA
jgi:hypothetical protein